MSSLKASAMQRMHGITFDLDDTLYCGKSVLLQATKGFHAYIKLQCPAVATAYPPDAFYKLLLHFQKTIPEQAHNYTFLRKHTLRYCVESLDSVNATLFCDDKAADTFIEDACEHFIALRSQPKVFDGVDQMLQRLRDLLACPIDHSSIADVPQSRIGIITNGNCRLIGLPVSIQSHFDFMISAEQVGKAKPSREIFNAAIKRFPSYIKAHELAHVGDDYNCDIVGAKRAGMKTIWINPSWKHGAFREKCESGCGTFEEFDAADAIVSSVIDVPEIIRSWQESESELVTNI